MGIPKFARWISQKYPDMVSKTPPASVAGLYVDMNGIIHPCCHSEDDPSVARRPTAEKLAAVCDVVQELVELLKPTNVVYLAMDGVAPRAKMNQQRARRYMAACTAAGDAQHGMEHFTVDEAERAEVELREAMGGVDFGIFQRQSLEDKQLAMCSPPTSPTTPFGGGGQFASDLFTMDFPSAKKTGTGESKSPAADSFHSNCISPGTQFMYDCAAAVRRWVTAKLNSDDPKDAAWKSRVVILSDTNTPGEGEHKIIDFLRTQLDARADIMQGGAHVVVGLDADLVLLCLSLHTSSVWIMRDRKRTAPNWAGKKKGKNGAQIERDDSAVDLADQLSTGGMPEGREASCCSSVIGTPAKLGVAASLCSDRSKTKASQQPSLADPSTNKYEYFKLVAVGDGIVSEITALATSEHLTGLNLKLADCEGGGPRVIDDFIAMASLLGNDFLPRLPGGFCGESAMDQLMEIYVRDVLPYGPLTKGGDLSVNAFYRLVRSFAEVETMKFRQQQIRTGKLPEREAAAPLWAPGVDDRWRREYYSTTSISQAQIVDACQQYLCGLRFVWQYYSKTTKQCAWRWYYPYHHAPLSSDLALYLRTAPALQPLPSSEFAPSPFTQLLCILPPTSHALLPEPYAAVMLSPPAELRDTFCEEWIVDYTASGGKEHLAVPLLPFANLTALEKLDAEIQLEHEMSLSAAALSRGRNVYQHEILIAQGADNVRSRLLAPHPTPDVAAESRKGLTFPFLFGKIAEASGCVTLEEQISDRKMRPRMYNSTLGIRNVTLTKLEELKAKRRARSTTSSSPKAAATFQRPTGSANGGDANGVVTLPTLTTIAVAAAAFSQILSCLAEAGVLAFIGTRLPFVAAVAGTVLLWINAMGLAGFAQWDRVVIQRNGVRETNVDWQCPECLGINFARNQFCFLCQFPYMGATCRAVYSSRIPSSPPLYEANHSISAEQVRLKRR